MTSFSPVQGGGFPARALRETCIVADMLEETGDAVCKVERGATEAPPTTRLSSRDTRALRRFARQVYLLLVALGA